jgi:hypothetical protein
MGVRKTRQFLHRRRAPRAARRQAAALDRLHAETGMTRSEAVRRALDLYLTARAEKFLQPADSIRVVSPAKVSDR